MIDGEKLLEMADDIKSTIHEKQEQTVFDYKIYSFCCQVQAMLKEQEAVEPTLDGHGKAYCSCGEMVGIISDYDNVSSVRMNHCPECGKEMIWSDAEKKKRTRNWYN